MSAELPPPLVPRRSFVKAAAFGAAGAALGVPVSAQSPTPSLVKPPAPPDEGYVRLGVASYSLRSFPRDQAIAMAKSLRSPYINLKSVHLAYELTPAELAAARQEIEAAGLRIVGGGTITFGKDTDEDVQHYFDYAKGAGMPLMVATANPAILPRVERFAKQYDIKVAIHNHGPEDKLFPSPYDVLKVVKNMDPRMGLCIDIGHTARTGTDVVQSIADAGSRLLDMHVKDLRDFNARESQCIVGEGLMPFPDIFRQLRAMRYAGYVNLEYEIDAKDPLPGMQRSFAYMRGVLAGLAPTKRAKAAGN
jgi:sugar phosphate isomerase/epimerase